MDNKSSGLSIPAHIILGLLTLVLLLPFYITVVNAFKTNVDIITSPLSMPFSHMSFDNFKHALTSKTFNMVKGYGTSIWVTGTSMLFIIIVSSMSSYIISRNKTRFFRGMYWYFVVGLFLPTAVFLIPVVKLLNQFHLLRTTYGLILFNIGSYMPFTIFLYTGFVRTISMHLDESAKIDGARTSTIFWKIIFPLLRPATGSLVIFLFLFIWNDFLNPLYILGPNAPYTVTIGIYYSIGKYSVDWQNVFAIIVLSSLPVVILFLLMQRQFIDGLTEGSVKG